MLYTTLEFTIADGKQDFRRVWRQNMLNDYYLNKELVTKLEKRKKVQLIVGGIFAPTTFLLILESIFHFGFLDASDTY